MPQERQWLKSTMPVGILGLGAILAVVILESGPEVERREPAAESPLVEVATVESEDVAVISTRQGVMSSGAGRAPEPGHPQGVAERSNGESTYRALWCRHAS